MRLLALPLPFCGKLGVILERFKNSQPPKFIIHSSFCVTRFATKWVHPMCAVRRMVVSSFWMGGVSAILELPRITKTFQNRRNRPTHENWWKIDLHDFCRFYHRMQHKRVEIVNNSATTPTMFLQYWSPEARGKTLGRVIWGSAFILETPIKNPNRLQWRSIRGGKDFMWTRESEEEDLACIGFPFGCLLVCQTVRI